MKKKYFVIVALIIFLGIPIVNADCSNEEIELLKKEANKKFKLESKKLLQTESFTSKPTN